MKDIPGMIEIVKNTTIFDQLINDMGNRHDKNKDKINFYEWLFIRQVADAWSISSGMKSSITKDELLDIGMKVIHHFNAYEG